VVSIHWKYKEVNQRKSPPGSLWIVGLMMNKLKPTSTFQVALTKLFIEWRWLGSPVREKRFLDTAPNVALNFVQMARVWSTQVPPKEYSIFGEVTALAFYQKSYLATCTCLQPLRDSQEVMTNNCASIENPLFFDVCFTMWIQPAKILWNILYGLNNIQRKWDIDTLRYRIYFHKVVSIYRYK
jgi:hypothetical protein